MNYKLERAILVYTIDFGLGYKIVCGACHAWGRSHIDETEKQAITDIWDLAMERFREACICDRDNWRRSKGETHE